MTKRVISLFLCVCLLFGVFSAAFSTDAATLYKVSVNGYFEQTNARKMLTYVNNFRTDKTQAWAWNPTDTAKEYYTLNKLTYDYDLEKIAMQRATELAVYYGHTRPNGKEWHTAHTQYNGSNGYYLGENVAAGQDSIGQVFQGWLETDKHYAEQSHRRLMLGGTEHKYTCMAVACFSYFDVYYWCMLFRSENKNPTPTSVGTAPADYSVDLSSDFINKIALADDYNNYVLNIGDSQNFSWIDGTLITTSPIVFDEDKNPFPLPVKFMPTNITTSNSNVITVSGTTLTAINAGTARITATFMSKSISITATVLKTNLTNAKVTLRDDTFIYTPGQTIVPSIESVTIGSKNVPASAYDYSYTVPDGIGTGVLTITGKGNYEGTAYATFDVIDRSECTHKKLITLPAVEATCQNKGLTEGKKCAVCGIIVQEQTVVPLQAHNIVPDKAVAATCVETGLTAGSHCSVCGKVVEEQQIVSIDPNNHKNIETIPSTPPTCKTAGLTEYKYCSACGAIINNQVVIPKLSHTIVSDSRVEATCTKEGHTAGSHCSVCGEVFEEVRTIPKLQHTYTVSQYKKATLSANGYKRSVCSRCGIVDPDDNTIYYYPKTFTLSKTNFTYNGKVQTPTLSIKSANRTLKNGVDYTLSYSSGRKNVGRYAIKVTFKGNYSGTKTVTYNIIPKSTAITSIAGVKKGFTARWRKQAVQTNGYQVQYSLYANFKTGTTLTAKSVNSLIVKVGKLTGGRRYYVRVRTYKTVKYAGKNVSLFSAWSPIKSVTAKK